MKKNLLLVITLLPQLALCAPKTIAILRHGEKQIDEDATKKAGKIKYTPYLSVKGHERAAALSEMFTKDSRFTQYGKPVEIFASGVYKNKRSVRPIDTIKPTAKTFRVKLNHKLGADEWEKLTHEIMTNKKYNGKYIIICYEHSHIKFLTSKKGFNAPQAPTTWKGSVFDRVFVLHMDENGKVVKFDNIPQQLMFGDSKD